MGQSIWGALRDLQDITERLVAGEFPQKTPLGPGIVQSKNIRARAVTAPLINVSNLEAVNTQTGNLSVDGAITVSTGGRIVSGTSTGDWTTFTTSPGGGLGYYLEYHDTLGARIAFGDFNNTTGQYVKWDGSALSIKGAIIASSGVIAGWTILTDSLTATDIGLASSGNGGYGIWCGNNTPGSAEFSVTRAGALVATSATITGDITANSGTIVGLLNVSGGLNMNGVSSSIRAGKSSYADASDGFYLSGGTLPLLDIGDATNYVRWNGTSLTVLGAINATSGNITGSMIIGTGGNIRSGQTAYDSGTGFFLEANSGTPRFSLGNSAGNKLTWNGSALSLVGSITATAGSIGGWTIDASGIRLGSGSTARGIDSGGFAFYAGSSTPSSAPFRVSTAGVFYSADATIVGTIDANAGTLADLYVDGDVTVSSGGKFRWGTSGEDWVDDNIMHFETSTSVASMIEFLNGSAAYRAAVQGKGGSSSSSLSLVASTTASGTRFGFVDTTNTTTTASAQLGSQWDGITNLASVLVQSNSTTGAVTISAEDQLILDGPLSIFNAGMVTSGPGVTYYGRIPVVTSAGTKYIHLYEA